MSKKATKEKTDVLIIDGYNMIYRSKYSQFAKNRDKNSIDDRSIVFSFVKTIRALINQFNPAKVYFVLEGMPKARLAIDSDYKGTRTHEIDISFSTQRKIIKNLINNIWPNISVIYHPDHECDDVANQLAKKYYFENKNAVIVSSDTDFIQTLQYKNVKIWNPIQKKFLECEFDPSLYAEWKSLRGDLGDNIIGFSGIGNVRALKLVTDKNLLKDFLSNPEFNKKFETNLSLIKFEEVDLNYCIVNNLSNDFEKFKQFLNDCNFSSITEETKWEKFILPIKNIG